MQNLNAKIEAALNRANELNSDSLEIKAEMALKNKLISPQQEKELFELVSNSESLYSRYVEGERTEDLLAGLEQHCIALEQKRNEIFPDAPKKAKLKLARPDSRLVSDESEQATRLAKKEESEAPEEAPGQKESPGLKIDEDLIAARAAEIKERRIKGEKGFEWKKIDEMIVKQGLTPGTPEAEEFIAKWDKNTAQSELRREEKKKGRKNAEGASGKKEFLKIRPVGKDEEAVLGQENGVETERKKEKELARLGTGITLAKITDYKELWAETEQAGDEVFKKKTHELWKEFAVHGKVLRDKESNKPKVMNFTDLDGKSSLGLLALAGIDTKNLEYKEPGQYTAGKINIDTGERHGVVVEDGGKTVFIDHHSDESGRDSSATKFTYELLVSLGLLEKQEHLDKLVEFVTQTDNKNYPGAEKYFKNYGRNLLGLKDHIKFKHLVEFFKEGHAPHEVLQEKELKKMELFQVSKQKEEAVKKSVAELERIEEKGLVVESPRYGKIAVDIGKKIPFGFDAVRYAGYQTYLSWSPADNSFFISSVEPITDSFRQGKKIRGHMWIKPAIDGEPLNLTLKEVLTIMTDGKFKPAGELAEFIAFEGSDEKKALDIVFKRNLMELTREEALGLMKDAAAALDKAAKRKDIEKKAELAPGVREILVSAVNEFRQRLQAEAEAMENWGKHKPEEQKILLEIETKSFLRELINKRLVSKGLVAEREVDVLTEDLLAEKAAVVTPQAKEAAEATVEIKKESKADNLENNPRIKAELENSVEMYKRLSQWDKDHKTDFVYEEAHQKDSAGFYRKFNTRIGLKNAMERRKKINKLLAPELSEDNAGYFFAQQLENNLFAVVPAINLRYDGFLGYIGGVDDVFENPNFVPADEKMKNLRVNDPKKYDVELVSPAIFEKKPDGSFNIVKKGSIKLKEINQ